MTYKAYGMVPHAHVYDVLEHILASVEQECTLIIRVVDSHRSCEELSHMLSHHDIAHTTVHNNVCVGTEAIREVLSRGIFNGFDEIWIIAGSPPAFDLASLPSATSDSADFSINVPEGLLDTMEQINCFLVLGDGCGLNFATLSPRIREHLEQYEP